VYKYAQDQEQAWEEKRRIREIEEVRAAAGGTYITQASTPDYPATNSSQEKASLTGTASIVEELRKAKDLLDQEIISDAEFNELKSKILNQGRSI
jgi:hypothetical protein